MTSYPEKTPHRLSTPPDEEQIAQLLGQMRPQPSANFQHRMQSAPWFAGAQHKPISPWLQFIHHYRMAVTIIILALAMASLLTISPLQGIARQVWDFFMPGQEDELTVHVAVTTPAEIYNFATVENFPLSIQEAEQQAGFSIRQPEELPPGAILVGARYEADYQAVIQLYQGERYNLFLCQRNLAGGQDYFNVGASAQIQELTIWTIPAEYVEGGWVVTGTLQTTPQADAIQVTLQAVWDPDLEQYTLRWQDDGYAFELRSTGIHAPKLDELVAIARSMK